MYSLGNGYWWRSLPGLQTTGYSYNERGWLKTSSSAELDITLGYNTGSGTLQYNGNISSQVYTNGGAQNIFTYSYDRLNRLTAGAATGMTEVLTYDVMGNIASLNRDGAGANTYNYTGNRLSSVATVTGSYDYDLNGNATTDGRNGVGLTYNLLNLPATASRLASGSITALSMSYTYDATGRKLRKVANTSGATDYVDGIQYANGTIDFIQTPVGIARRNGITGAYSYEYNLSDHLGNVRATFYYNPATSQLQVLQRDDYYAFGMRKVVAGGNNNYLYNGKELQDELDGQYDYGARFYDPVVGRWNVIDPLSEAMRRHSPYNYAFNNPLRFVDPDGMAPDDFVKRGDGSIYWDKNANDQSSTKSGETYLGKELTFVFNSFIDGNLWDGPMGDAPVGDKLTSTIKLTGNENEAGELTSITASRKVEVGETPVGKARDFYPGEGGRNNVFNLQSTSTGISLNFEQHASVSFFEQKGLNLMGYKIVDVAQKLNINYDSKSGNLSLSSYTNIFPSATLSVNNQNLMRYAQPSFEKTHRAPPSHIRGVKDFSYYPSKFYKR